MCISSMIMDQGACQNGTYLDTCPGSDFRGLDIRTSRLDLGMKIPSLVSRHSHSGRLLMCLLAATTVPTRCSTSDADSWTSWLAVSDILASLASLASHFFLIAHLHPHPPLHIHHSLHFLARDAHFHPSDVQQQTD
ncbi:hypothetical protein CLAIMM_06320 [Cladophialophora immunda]|nr:hypothetical protein CLAIMM_06320 [Cladophialophora immunda]